MKKIAKLLTLALGVFMLASCEDVPSPYGTVTPPEEPTKVLPTGDGTKDNPYNVAGAIEKCQEIGPEVSKDKYYVKGLVVATASADAQYGNVTFYIHDEGSNTKFYCYQVAGPDGKKLSEGYTFKVDDEVVIYGPMYNYNGNTPETASKGAAWVVLHNGEIPGGGDTPSGEYGTKDNPLTVAQVLAVINGLADNGTASPAYVKGKISKVQSYNEQYKSITYYISDDGTDANALQIYSGKGIDGADFAAATDLEKGWTVVVTGELKKYVNKNTGAVTPEINQSSKIVSIDKTTGGGGGEVTPDQPKGNGTEGNPFNVAAAVAKCVETGETPTTESYYIKGIADEDYTIGSYKNLEVNIVDKEGCAQKFKVFRVKDKDGKDLKNGWKIAKGSTIIVYGPVVNYKGNTPETATGAYLVSVNGEAPQLDDGTSGGGSGGGDTGSADITAAFGDLDCSDITSIKLSDGTTLSLAQEDGSNAPVYHASTKALRIYARNSLTINAGSKKINKVELAYDTYNGTAYKGNDEMYGEAGSDKLTPTKDDKNVTFNGVNNSTLKVVNWREAGTTGGTQLRLTGISITYVK